MPIKIGADAVTADIVDRIEILEQGGIDGLNCWDLDNDNECDQNEDNNTDGYCDAYDCQGPQGDIDPQGPEGPQGEPGPTGPQGPADPV